MKEWHSVEQKLINLIHRVYVQDRGKKLVHVC